MKITTDEHGQRYVQGDGCRAYPKGGGYWDMVCEHPQGHILTAAWVDIHEARSCLKESFAN